MKSSWYIIQYVPMKIKESGVCVCVCGRGGGFKIRVSNNPYVTFVGTTNRPMAPQSISIKDSMYRSPYTTWCGKLEYTDGISISKQLSPRIPQTLDPKPNFQQNKGNIHLPISPGIQYQCNVITSTYLDATFPTNLSARNLMDH